MKYKLFLYPNSIRDCNELSLCAHNKYFCFVVFVTFLFSFAFVIYISVRVMKEHITSEVIANQIGSDDEAFEGDAVELSDKTFSYRDNKGSYANVISTEERGETI